MGIHLIRTISKSSIISNAVKGKSFLEIPGPKSFPIFGSLFNYIPPFGKFDPNRLHVAGRLKYELYGKLVREEILPGVHYLFLYDPVDMETLFRNEGRYPSRRSHTALEKIRTVDTAKDHNSAGLLPTSGEEWNKMRISFQQALGIENVRKLIPKSDEIITEFCIRINEPEMVSCKNDFLPSLMHLALELVGENFFGVRVGNSKYDKYTIADILVKAAEEVNAATASTDMGFQLWRWIDTPYYTNIKTNILTIEKTALYYINQYMASRSSNPNCILGTWIQDESLDVKDIVTMSGDMILAGIDTTSFTMSFVLYHLATHPLCQNKLYDELKGLLPTNTSQITQEILSKAIYLKRCLKESLRLNPISLGVGRTIQSDVVIGGYHVPPNTVAVTMNQVSCRLWKYFEEPDNFIPDRWKAENKKMHQIHPFLLLPFGYGPRGCIGRRLAEQQLQLMTARIFRLYSLRWNGKNELGSIGMINRPDAPLQFTFTPRLE